MRFRIYPKNPFYRTAFLISYLWISYTGFNWIIPSIRSFSEAYNFRDAENFFLIFLAITWLFFISTFALEIQKKEWKIIIPYVMIVGIPVYVFVQFSKVYVFHKYGEETNGQIIAKNDRKSGMASYRVKTKDNTYRFRMPNGLEVGHEIPIIEKEGKVLWGSKSDTIASTALREVGFNQKFGFLAVLGAYLSALLALIGIGAR